MNLKDAAFGGEIRHRELDLSIDPTCPQALVSESGFFGFLNRHTWTKECGIQGLDPAKWICHETVTRKMRRWMLSRKRSKQVL